MPPRGFVSSGSISGAFLRRSCSAYSGLFHQTVQAVPGRMQVLLRLRSFLSQPILDGSDSARSAALQVLERRFLARQIPEIPEPLILDIDLDYFLCDAALHPSDPSFFLELAERARLITVSLERDWVRLLRFRGECISADSLWESLLSLLS